MNRISSDKITSLHPNEIFVFGSNEAGKHGRCAAQTAYFKFGAKYGIGNGMSGSSYGIPTKDKQIKTLPLKSIEIYVNQFINYASIATGYNFLVTEIGCGLAGYAPSDIAPLFQEAMYLRNIYLPKSFVEILFNIPNSQK